jgi:N utilization substance protein B
MKKSNRRILREKSLQVLYAYEMNSEGLQTLIDGVLSDIEEKPDKEFSSDLIHKVITNKKELDEKISERVTNWEMDRIALIDRILLRIGITEILHFPDIPPKVSINEVIEIAKDYSTSNSSKFINGILDAILTDLKKSGKLNKTGRGLIDETLTKKNK